MAKIYLDHGATTPIHPQVVAKITESLTHDFGNASSVHQFGRSAQGKMENARQIVATSLNAKADEIIFTSGGTESNNSAIIQTARLRQDQGRHIITSAIEHPAVLATMAFLATEGFEITYLSVDKHGHISLAEFKAALRPETILVSLMYINNEIGITFPISEIGELLREHQAYFHTDAVQAYGLEEIDVGALGIDLLTGTAHKINGPKGLGFLYIREGVIFEPFFHGGEQELKRRPGTENLPSILGLAEATKLLSPHEKIRRKEEYAKFSELITTNLKQAGIDFVVNGDSPKRSPHILNLWLKGIPNDLVLMHLDLQGIGISIGSACTAGNIEPSHVLEALYGENHQSTKESVRISFGLGNTVAEITQFSQVLIEIVQRLKK